MIIGGTLTPFELFFRRPFQAGGQKISTRRGWCVTLQDSSGMTGMGEASPWNPPDFMECESSLHTCLRSLRGLSTERDSFLTLPLHGSPSAIFAVETAWLDLHSKHLGLPCRKLLNLAASAAVAVNGLIDQGVERDIDFAAEHFLRQGYPAVKVKLGRADFREDLDVVRRLRALLPNIMLRGDANGAWSADEARLRLEALAPFGFEYVEQPMGAHDFSAWHALRERSPIPIAIDESLRNLDDVQQCVSEGAADRLIFKPQRLGGFRATLEALKIAQSASIPVTFTGQFESAIGTTALLHAAAAWLPSGSIAGLDTQHWFRSDMAPLPLFSDGTFHLGSEPGLGTASPQPTRHAG